MNYQFGLGCLLAILSPLLFSQNHYQTRENIEDCVNIRVAPSTTFETFHCIKANVPLIVIDSVPFWRKIIFDAQTGLIAKKFIIPTSSSLAQGSEKRMEIHFVDVGQGDAIWLHTADDLVDGNGIYEGKNIIIDGDPYSSDYKNPLLHYIESRSHHAAMIDALIVSHPHTDHYRGAETIRRHFEIDHYYDPGFPAKQVGYNKFIDSLTERPDLPPVNHIHRGSQTFGSLDWGSEINAGFIYSWL